MLPRVVADDTDLPANLRALGIQRQGLRLDEVELARIVTIETEVMHRITIDGVELHLLAVEERGLRGNRSGGDDVTVGQDQAPLGVDHESGRLRRGIPLRVEGPGCIDIDRHHTARDPLESHRPVGITFDRGGLLRHLRRLLPGAWREHRGRLRGQRL